MTTTTEANQCPNIVNICRKRADTFPFVMTFTDAETGVAINLTGGTIVLTVNSLAEPPDATTELFQIAGVIVGAPTNGQVSFTPSALDADQTPGTYFYDVQLTVGSSVRTLVEGEWQVQQDRTK